MSRPARGERAARAPACDPGARCPTPRSAAPREASLPGVLVLLPPSETKAHDGDAEPLDLATLSFPELNPVRRSTIDAVTSLAGDTQASLATLGLSERQSGEIERNAALWTSATMPAVHRYTGVLYDALDPRGFTPAERTRAHERLAVTSALFGLVRSGDRIPAYRLSAGTNLPGVGSLRRLWRPVLEPALAALDEMVIDLRSGPYAALARVTGAVTVRVVTDDGAGKRTTVSHRNKAYKGRLAGALVRTSHEPADADELLTVARTAGFKIDRTGEYELEMLTE